MTSVAPIRPQIRPSAAPMSRASTAVVQAVGLTKHFRDFWHRKRVVAVDRLDLEIRRNEVFGLLGAPARPRLCVWPPG